MSTVIPQQYTDLLQSTALAHIATIGPKGSRRAARSGSAGTASSCVSRNWWASTASAAT